MTSPLPSQGSHSRSNVLDSSEVAAQVAKGGTLAFYFQTLLKDPRKILLGVAETLSEVCRFVIWPRFAVGLNGLQRAHLILKWGMIEVRVPGATTLLETTWLAYGAARSTSTAKSWVEVGCFKGLSTVRLSLLCSAWDRHLYAFDTFAGLPGSDSIYAAVDDGVSYHFKAGSYAGSEEEVTSNVDRHGDPACVTLIKGDVEHTLHENTLGPISFAFLDVDLVESYRACFSGLARSIGAGTVIAIHEACYAPIRELVGDAAFWEANDLALPRTEYVAERYGVRSCRNMALLFW
jgi:hypothetical protein